MDEPFDFSGFRAELGEAQAALAAFARGPAQDAANTISDAFGRSGERIAKALTRAAGDGEGAFRRLTKVVLEELAKIALDKIFSAAPARQSTHASVQSALVAPAGREGGALAVHFHLNGGDGESLRRNQAQIAAQVARAAAYGRRNL